MSYPPNSYGAPPGAFADPYAPPSHEQQDEYTHYGAPAHLEAPQGPPRGARFASSPRPSLGGHTTSSYSVHDEKDDYGAVDNEDYDDVAPLAGNAGYAGASGSTGFSGGFIDPRQRNTLSRRQTNAEAWKKRQQLGRAQTKRVQLGAQGNLIAEYKVPTAILNANKAVADRQAVNDHPEEWTHLRYTAATCDPDEFTTENGWSLRASTYGRTTDLLIAITYYNEDKVLVARTLHSVMENVRDIVKKRYSEFRRAGAGAKEAGHSSGDDSWKRIVVSLVFDGIDPADPNTMDVLACLGIYQDAIVKGAVNDIPTVAHIFEYTTAISFSPKTCNLVIPDANDPNGLVPVQMIFCLKQKNTKKINSHRWLFNAISHHLQPDVCILLDAGTKPSAGSLYYLWEAFYHDKHLGGACGEIHAMLGRGGKKLLNPLVAAQNFEYKMSNILDKPTESSFGYVSVLPGAFSAYRFQAIQGRPLQQYFHGDHTMAERLGSKGIMGMSIFKKNMFLAEDRILCFELVAKANSSWTLGYVKPAKGETDVPEQAAELIGQRRRWLNGSFAAGVYALFHFARIYRSSHNPLRMFFFHVQALYNLVQLIMSWFMLGNFFLTFAIILKIVEANWSDPLNVTGGFVPPADDAVALKQITCWAGTPFLQTDSKFQNSTLAEPNLSGFLHEHNFLRDLNWSLEVVYLALIAFQIILALGNRPKGERFSYAASIWAFAILAAYLIAATVILTVMAFCPLGVTIEAKGSVVKTLLGFDYGVIFAGILGTFGVYIISSFLYLDPWHIFHSMPQYLLIAPSFTNILNIYAFCNLHDVSWGTKGSDKADALPTVTSKKDGKSGEIEVAEKKLEDLDAAFKEVVTRAKAPLPPEDAPEKPGMDDQNKTFRTRLVSTWLFMNAILAVAIARLGVTAQSKYFQLILIITFGLSSIRFLGFLYYMLGESVFRLVRLCTRRKR